MMLIPLPISALVSSMPFHTSKSHSFAPVVTWYGPKEVSFELPPSGNPYDPTKNDVRVKFVNASGHVAERIAFWNGSSWNAILLTRFPGVYHARVIRNGTLAKHLPGAVRAETKESIPFVEIANDHYYFATENGKPFWPVGHDMGWHNGGDPVTIPDQLNLMGKSGLNWARIWACSFDGKCPWWSVPIGQLDQKSYAIWDQIFNAAAKSGVRVQWTLFHHGQVSSLTDPNWGQNPWNVANGGFLKTPQDFFTSSRAIALCKEYLRYDIARYASDPSLFGWEIFNEVQWSNTAHDGNWNIIAKWHRIMADYIRSLDPYHHPVTSSSNLPANVNASLDYINQHGYPASVQSMLLADKPPHDKPYFYAEVGPSGNGSNVHANLIAARDGLWGGVLACDSASGMYWYWDRVSKMGFYPEYKFDTSVLKHSGFLAHSDRAPFALKVVSPGHGDLSFAPGRGWANGGQVNFQFPQDYENGSVGQIATFFQGKGHADMKTGPLSFQFEAATSGEFRVTVTGEAKNGADLTFNLNGTRVHEEIFAPNASDRRQVKTIVIPFEPGTNTITMSNKGADWVIISKFTITGIGPAVMGHAMGDKTFCLARLESANQNQTSNSASLSQLPLENGRYKLTIANLNLRTNSYESVIVRNGKLTNPIHLTDSDVIVILNHQ